MGLANLLFFLAFGNKHIVDGYNILFLPLDISHSRNIAPFAEQLALRGHYVKIWFINGGVSMVDKVQNVSYESLPISMADFRPSPTFYQLDKLAQKIHPILNLRLVWAVNESLFLCSRLLAWHRYVTYIAESILKFSDKLEQLKAVSWDLVVTDEFPPNLCQRAITRHLAVPYVLWSVMLPPALFHDGIDIPHQPAFYPTYSYGDATLKTFAHRLLNFLSHLIFINTNGIANCLIGISNSRYYNYYKTDRFASNSLLSMTQRPTDFHYPQSHRLIYSTLDCKKCKRLESKWKTFIERPESNGTIVLSMGSLVFWSSAMIDSFFEAAVKLQNVSFVWHLRLPQSLPDLTLPNVRIGSWIPLNSLLAHRKTSLLVNPASARSMYEAISNEVPLLAIPIQFDHFRNSAMVKAMNIGITIQLEMLTNENVLASINNLINCRSYATSIRKHKHMLLDTMSPTGNITTFHLERAARRTFSLKLYSHSIAGNYDVNKYFCIDIVIATVVVVVLAYLGLYFLLHICYNHCCFSQFSKDKDKCL